MLNVQADLWEKLQDEHRPILLYGMGNGADKILAVCKARGIPVCDTFASDGFVRGQIFHDKRVLSRTEAEAKYGDMVVLLSFASARPDVMETIADVAARHTLYVPDVPVAGETLFDRAYYTAHADAFDAARELFADAASRECFDRVLYGKLTGELAPILAADDAETVWREILTPARYRSYADLGAYNGDTIRELRSRAPNLSRIFAMEPDARNFRKLTAWAEEAGVPLSAVQAAAWESAGNACFTGSGNRNAALTPAGAERRKNDGKREAVSLLAPDTLFAGADVDFIKFDVEGAEREALLGTRETIARCTPDLLVSAYHRAEDLAVLPALIRELQPRYRLYLRKLPSIPMWDINLYATAKQ